MTSKDRADNFMFIFCYCMSPYLSQNPVLHCTWTVYSIFSWELYQGSPKPVEENNFFTLVSMKPPYFYLLGELLVTLSSFGSQYFFTNNQAFSSTFTYKNVPET
jgi:hypothetical protein